MAFVTSDDASLFDLDFCGLIQGSNLLSGFSFLVFEESLIYPVLPKEAVGKHRNSN